MPTVWLVPRRGELQWMISHRGLMQLCRRAGYQLSAVTVGTADHIEVEFGEVTEHRAKVGCEPTGIDDLAGVIVSCRRLSDSCVLGRYWLPGSDIRKRSKVRGAGPVWKDWPLEMAMKSAIKWACARGLVPIESIELDQALSADTRAEIEAPAPIEVPQPAGLLPSDVFGIQSSLDEIAAQVRPEPVHIVAQSEGED